jgi:hypothetical protein
LQWKYHFGNDIPVRILLIHVSRCVFVSRAGPAPSSLGFDVTSVRSCGHFVRETLTSSVVSKQRALTTGECHLSGQLLAGFQSTEPACPHHPGGGPWQAHVA